MESKDGLLSMHELHQKLGIKLYFLRQFKQVGLVVPTKRVQVAGKVHMDLYDPAKVLEGLKKSGVDLEKIKIK